MKEKKCTSNDLRLQKNSQMHDLLLNAVDSAISVKRIPCVMFGENENETCNTITTLALEKKMDTSKI